MRAAWAAMTCLCVSAIAARADAAPRSEAERLFDEAKAMADAGRWTEACPRLAESFRIEPNMTTEFRLADCYERIGKSASAWTHYVASARSAGAAGEAAKERFASERAAKLAPSVDRLVIVTKVVPELVVERDGRAVPPSARSTPTPIDPGEHTVHAWAPGKSSYDALVTVAGKGTMVRVEVPELEPALQWRLAIDAKPTSLSSTMPDVVRTENAPPSSSGSVRPWAIGLGVAGLAAIGVGGGLYLDARSDHPGNVCGDGRCTGSVALVSAGGVALVVGTVLLLSSYIH